MNIAICDDEKTAAKDIEELVDSIFKGVSKNYACEVFSSGDSLLKYIRNNSQRYQIYLLDIEMDGANGIETATQIRKEDADAIIIFITNYEQYMPEAFDVQAFHYITKPFDIEKATQVILSAIDLLNDRNTIFTYNTRKSVNTIYLSQILYIESKSRKLVIHTTDSEEIEFYGKMKDAASKITALNFGQPHNSYLVNMEKIKKVESSYIIMQNDQKILISKKFHNSFHNSYRNFILLLTK